MSGIASCRQIWGGRLHLGSGTVYRPRPTRGSWLAELALSDRPPSPPPRSLRWTSAGVCLSNCQVVSNKIYPALGCLSRVYRVLLFGLEACLLFELNTECRRRHGELSSGMQWRMNAGLDFIAEKAIKIDRASERSSMKSTRDASSLLAQRWLSDWKGALSLRWATFRRAEVRR